MTTHKMNVKQPYFSMIALGEKTFELRLYDEKRSIIQPGDEIIFSNNFSNGVNETRVKVVGLVRAQTFEDLFTLIPIEKCGFSTKEEAIFTMEEFYSIDAQKRIGVVAIAIKRI